jgi:hypothetical protein
MQTKLTTLPDPSPPRPPLRRSSEPQDPLRHRPTVCRRHRFLVRVNAGEPWSLPDLSRPFFI